MQLLRLKLKNSQIWIKCLNIILGVFLFYFENLYIFFIHNNSNQTEILTKVKYDINNKNPYFAIHGSGKNVSYI